MGHCHENYVFSFVVIHNTMQPSSKLLAFIFYNYGSQTYTEKSRTNMESTI